VGGLVGTRWGVDENGLTFGTSGYHHGLLKVEHIRSTTTRSISSEGATVEGSGAATPVGNINCPSISFTMVIYEKDEDKDDVGVVHIQPSTTSSMSIFKYDEGEGGDAAVVPDVHNAIFTRTLPNTRPLICAAGDRRVLVLQR